MSNLARRHTLICLFLLFILMSSDLWSAFASSEDPTSNPWAQTAGDGTGGPPSPHSGSAAKGSVNIRDLREALPVSPDPWAQSLSGPQQHAAEKPQSDVLWEYSGDPSKLKQRDSWATAEERDEEDGDDFGDFEDAKPTRATSATVSALGDRPNPVNPDPYRGTTSVSAQPLSSSQVSDPYGNLDQLFVKGSTSHAGANSPPVPQKAQSRKPDLALVQNLVPYTEEDWGEFSPEPVAASKAGERNVKTATSNAHAAPATSKDVQDRASVLQKGHTQGRSAPKSDGQSSPPKLAPTNVPPPSILIVLVTGLVIRLPEQVERVLKGDNALAHPPHALEAALRRCIASLRVAARITAGRKLRWKRDQQLSQSMRIGLAGKARGMKVTGVDKTEVQREDREAAEFVRTWQQKLGGIRSALATVNSNVAGQPLALPAISTTMAVRTPKQSQGSTLAAKYCFLCGLKREERVDKVDVDVWDNFEEFWTLNWGHTECKAFWLEHERYLEGRREFSLS